MSKPCFVCGKPSELTHGDRWFDSSGVFDDWVHRNLVICPWRARFDGMRNLLDWASMDENDVGAHAQCALKYAVQREGYAERYPADTEEELSK